MGVALLDQFIDLAQCVFTATLRAKSITRLLKLMLKDRLDHQLERRLHDAILDHGDAQRAQLAAPSGNLYALDRLWPVLPALERLFKLCQIVFRSKPKLLDALPIDSGRAGVLGYFLPGRSKRLVVGTLCRSG